MLRTLTTLACLMPALAFGQSGGDPLLGRTVAVNNGPGDQTDPHVDGSWVTYTNQSSPGSSEIRYHDLVTGLDQAIPTQGGYDSLADVSGDTVVFTRATDASRVFGFNLRDGGTAQELAPRPGVDRRSATVGGHSVAWQELGYTAASQPEIFAYHADTQALTRLTEDTNVDRTPAVSEDGSAVVWTKCAPTGDGCDIWSAREVEGGYQVLQLTGAEGEESLPDTNGDVAVYVTRRTINGVTDSDIAWQSLSGGEIHRLALPGTDSNPSVSGSIIAFERKDPSSTSPNFDIMLYDLRSETFYRLTNTPESESLSDISVDPNGLARVVWTVRQNGDLNVYAFAFRLPGDCQPATIPDPAAVCAAPGARPLLGTLRVSRVSSDEPQALSTNLDAHGTGVLCVDNGVGGTLADSGWVWLGAGLKVGPDSFGPDVDSISQVVPLQGPVSLSALADGAVGSGFQVRVYGELSCDLGLGDGMDGSETLYGQFLTPESLGSSNSLAASAYFVPSGYEGWMKTSTDTR